MSHIKLAKAHLMDQLNGLSTFFTPLLKFLGCKWKYVISRAKNNDATLPYSSNGFFENVEEHDGHMVH